MDFKKVQGPVRSMFLDAIGMTWRSDSTDRDLMLVLHVSQYSALPVGSIDDHRPQLDAAIFGFQLPKAQQAALLICRHCEALWLDTQRIHAASAHASCNHVSDVSHLESK